MKHYYIKSNPGAENCLSILGETDEGYMVRIYHDLDGYEKISDEFMSAELFESCVRTGYLSQIEETGIGATA